MYSIVALAIFATSEYGFSESMLFFGDRGLPDQREVDPSSTYASPVVCICMYVCMYVCMYACTDVWMYGCIQIFMYFLYLNRTQITYIYIYIPVYIYIYMYMYMHVRCVV